MLINSSFWHKSGVQESKTFSTNYLTKFLLLIDLDGILYAVQICWSDETHPCVTLADQYLRERTLLIFLIFVLTFTIQYLSKLVSWWRPRYSTLWSHFGSPWPSCKVTVVSTKTFVPIFSQISQSIWTKFRVLPPPVGLLKLMLNLFCMIGIWGRKCY